MEASDFAGLSLDEAAAWQWQQNTRHYATTELIYDPQCERVDTAVKAIWLLFRWGKWQLLEQIGMPRDAVEEDLVRFDMEEVVADHGRIHTEAQTLKLRRYCPLVLYGALMLLKGYQKATVNSRIAYYEHLEHIRELLNLAAQGDDDDESVSHRGGGRPGGGTAA
jgi:hypothetical protein